MAERVPAPGRLLHGASSGTSTRRVQQALAGAGYDPGPVDSVFGPLLARAVRAFQTDRGLPVTGVVDERTWAALAPESPPLTHPVLGAVSGDDVVRAQTALRDAGFSPGQIDGVFGPDTERAVVQFQRARRIAVDGLVGPETWAALLADAGPAADAGTGSRPIKPEGARGGPRPMAPFA